MDAEKYKKYLSSTERSVHFWNEARGESRKITAARLKCAPHSDAAESLAITIWERMTTEQFRLVEEIDRLLTAHEEIRVGELRETLGQILEAVNVEIKELKAVHHNPLEALTLLLNHIIKIYNHRDVEGETSSEFVPVSTRIEQMVAKAKELGLGNIEIPKYMYVSERAKMAMVEKQIIGRMKTKSLHKVKFKIIGGGRKRDETRLRLKKAVAIKEKLKSAQTVKSSRSKGYLKLNPQQTDMLREYSSLLMTDGDQANSCHSHSSIILPNGSCDSEKTDYQNDHFTTTAREDTEGNHASIDTSSWVISSTHKYYFGSSPPVIPKTSVTHEVYAKPVEDSEMTELENTGVNHLRFFHNEGDADDDRVGPKTNFPSKFCLDKTVLSTGKEMSDAEREKAHEVKSAGSSESRDSFSMITTNEEINCEESHGDASTIFAWTEPEKSHSFCLNPAENVIEFGSETYVIRAGSDAAGDGCDLARTREESSIHTLHEDSEEMEVLPPTAFSMTNVAEANDSNTSFLSENSSTEVQKKNLFSCNQFAVDLSKREGDASGIITKTDTQTAEMGFVIEDLQASPAFESDDEQSSSNELTSEENADGQMPPLEAPLEKTSSAAQVSAEPVNDVEDRINRLQTELQFTVREITTVSPWSTQTEKITPAQKYIQPSSSASNMTNPKLSKSIIDELTVEILKRNSMTGNADAKKETGDSRINSEKDFQRAGTSQAEDMCKGDNFIVKSSIAPSQSSYNGINAHNADGSRNEEKTVWSSSPSLNVPRESKELEKTQQIKSNICEPRMMKEDQNNQQPVSSDSSASKEVTSTKSVDQFSSAHDFGGTQLLYIRPDTPKQKTKLSKPSKARAAPTKEKPVVEARPSCSTHSHYEPVSDVTPSQACLEKNAKKEGKRNDMMTLALVAFTLGLGTLGFMTSSGSGSGGILYDVLGPAGGKALSVIEKALQVLWALKKRN